MAYIKFENEKKMVSAQVFTMNTSVVRIVTVDKPVLTGFRLYLDAEGKHPMDNGEYMAYTTLYRQGDGWYELSTDGSVYQEPIEEETVPPTLEEQLLLAKVDKKREVSAVCEQIIYAGISVRLVDGSMEHFALTEHDQMNLFGKQMQLASGEDRLEYHADGQPCRYYSATDMQSIIQTAMWHVSYHTTYCNALNVWIESAESVEEVQDITYGITVPETYCNEVLRDMMTVSAQQVQEGGEKNEIMS